MNINRHNYEEYFILYMDNELSSEERRMVELFIDNNADLKDELDILLQYKMEPDNNIVFEGKEELMKLGGETPITLGNYEEWLVLYMDNEMTADQRKSMEQFIAANPSIQKEVDLLLSTQLQPETIVFANKELLYRKEEKEKVRPILWWRVAAAVLVILLGTTAVIMLNNKGGAGKDDIANIAPAKEGTDKQNAVADNSTDPKNNAPLKEEAVKENQQAVITDNIPAEVATANSPANKIKLKKENTDKNVKLNEVIQAPTKNNEELVNNKPSNNLPQPTQNRNIVTNNAPENAVAKNDVPKEATNAKTSLTTSFVTKENTPPSDYINTSLTKLNTDGDVALEQPGKKGKLRGFFRKVTRTFEKRTNIDPTEDDEKLLLGGLAIRLK